MTTVVGLTASRMQQIEAASVVDGDVVGGDLILTKHDGTQINAGSVIGPAGPQGVPGLGPIPGEIKLWPGANLPNQAEYGLWTWANGGIFDVATYPIANAHISSNWKTAMGLPPPGTGKFRVPDLRGLVPAGLDAMPVGSARVNRMARSVAITIAAKTGEEFHVISIPELAPHAHQSNYYTNRNFAGYGGTGGNEASNQGDSAGAKIDAVDPAGSGLGHETVQPTIMVPYIVKLDD